jgi:hypothetical protein
MKVIASRVVVVFDSHGCTGTLIRREPRVGAVEVNLWYSVRYRTRTAWLSEQRGCLGEVHVRTLKDLLWKPTTLRSDTSSSRGDTQSMRSRPARHGLKVIKDPPKCTLVARVGSSLTSAQLAPFRSRILPRERLIRLLGRISAESAFPRSQYVLDSLF